MTSSNLSADNSHREASSDVPNALPKRQEPAAEAERCEICGSPTTNRHCKIVCPNCGHRRDCSDP